MQMIVCSICGQRFDASQHQACQECPLQKGCILACCPNCGYEMVNVHTSKLARLAGRWLHNGNVEHTNIAHTLADLSPGQSARVVGFSAGMPFKQQTHLLAYGIAPGHLVHVLQHEPVTIVQVEHLELALETDIARDVLVSIQARNG